MSASLDRWKRIVATGISFAAFGLGSLALGCVLVPALALVTHGAKRERRVQAVIRSSFHVFIRMMELLDILRVTIRDAERLAEPAAKLVIANHPTLLDTVLLVAAMPQAVCVVGRSYWSNPFMAAIVRGAGYVPNDGGEATVAACVKRVRGGQSVLFFPEGTRSPRRGLGDFQRGAAHVALASGAAAVPVTIVCEPRSLARGQPWYDVPERRMEFSLSVGAPIPTGRRPESRARASRQLTAEYREHFEKELGDRV